jgi:hypothetical protein
VISIVELHGEGAKLTVLRTVFGVPAVIEAVTVDAHVDCEEVRLQPSG